MQRNATQRCVECAVYYMYSIHNLQEHTHTHTMAKEMSEGKENPTENGISYDWIDFLFFLRFFCDKGKKNIHYVTHSLIHSLTHSEYCYCSYLL